MIEKVQYFEELVGRPIIFESMIQKKGIYVIEENNLMIYRKRYDIAKEKKGI